MVARTETVIAANRFGLGARPGDLDKIGDSPREWLLAQVQQPRPLLKSVGEVSTSKEAILMQLEYRRQWLLAQTGNQCRPGPRRPMPIISR